MLHVFERRTSLFWMAAFLGLTLFSASASDVWAHGPGGAALGILSLDEANTPNAVRLTTGVAVKTGSGWRFVCPTRWGGLELPPSASNGTFPVWILGEEQLYTVEASGDVRVLDTAGVDLTARNMLDIDANASAVYVLDTRGQLWRLGPDGQAQVIASDVENGFSNVAALDHELVLARRDSADLMVDVERRSLDGTAQFRLSLDNPDDAAPILRAAGSALFLARVSTLQHSLEQLELADGTTTVLASSDKPILGPVVDDDVPLLSVLGRLQAFENGQLRELDSERALACVGALRTRHYACVLPHLYAISKDTLDMEPLFTIDVIQPPDVSDLNEEKASLCELDWLHFVSEAGLDPKGPNADQGVVEEMPDASTPDVAVVETPEERSPGCGCTVMERHRSGSALWGMVAMGLLILLRRSA